MVREWLTELHSRHLREEQSPPFSNPWMLVLRTASRPAQTHLRNIAGRTGPDDQRASPSRIHAHSTESCCDNAAELLRRPRNRAAQETLALDILRSRKSVIRTTPRFHSFGLLFHLTPTQSTNEMWDNGRTSSHPHHPNVTVIMSQHLLGLARIATPAL